VPDNDYRGFLRTYLSEEALEPGEIVDVSGRVLGRHPGIHAFTVGQRRGLGIPWSEPLYVLRIIPNARQVVVGPRELLAGRTMEANDVSWVSGKPPAKVFQASVRIRYRHQQSSARVETLADRQIRVTFDEPQAAITPGQAVVLYLDQEVLGGGWIRAAEDEAHV
jgi:tRNA-specific 2-thiouridylase